MSFKSSTAALLYLLYLPFTIAACQDEEFRCSNGRCIPEEEQCDGGNDCFDNSDEDTPCGGGNWEIKYTMSSTLKSMG